MNNDFFRQLEPLAKGETLDLQSALDALAFNEQGLVPAIAQQHDTGEILMLAWMNKEALLATLEEQKVCYWSRSRQELWRKGETSGHRQHLVEMRLDCDGDAVLCLVDQSGPACHTNRNNCFYLSVQGEKLKIISDMPSAS